MEACEAVPLWVPLKEKRGEMKEAFKLIRPALPEKKKKGEKLTRSARSSRRCELRKKSEEQAEGEGTQGERIPDFAHRRHGKGGGGEMPLRNFLILFYLISVIS